MLHLFFALTMLTTAFAKTIMPKQENYPVDEVMEFKAIMEALKPFGEFAEKKSVEETKTEPEPKTLSQGERMIEEAKARNRAILAAQAEESKKFFDKKSEMNEMDRLKLETKRTQQAWKKEVRDTLKAWQKEQAIFLGKLKVYKENTFVMPVKTEKIVEKKVSVSSLPDVHIVNGTFKIMIRDQAARATCSAFAGVKAMEIIMAQNDAVADLSEQYFYWASKPNCQSSPCSQKGSWITNALRFSQEQPMIDIPEESNCSYKTQTQDTNETQIPLASECKVGRAKVTGYEEVRTLAEVIDRLKHDIPVVMAAKLSENFYVNKGLISLEDSKKSNGGKMDAHAMGHAFLAVGVIELPSKLHATEGTFCLVIANSWGKGWGSGGYSCATENWLTQYRQPSPFVAITKIEVK